MNKEKSYTMAERARMKMDLTVNQPLSYSQLYDLNKVKKQVKILWQENGELYNYLEKARLYALLVGKQDLWTEWWEANKFSIGFKKLNEFFEKLKYRLCEYCGNPFSEGRADRIYCSDTCRVYACTKKERKELTAIDK